MVHCAELIFLRSIIAHHRTIYLNFHEYQIYAYFYIKIYEPEYFQSALASKYCSELVTNSVINGRTSQLFKGK